MSKPKLTKICRAEEEEEDLLVSLLIRFCVLVRFDTMLVTVAILKKPISTSHATLFVLQKDEVVKVVTGNNRG